MQPVLPGAPDLHHELAKVKGLPISTSFHSMSLAKRHFESQCQERSERAEQWSLQHRLNFVCCHNQLGFCKSMDCQDDVKQV